MGQEIKVDRKLIFRNSAAHQQNVEGNVFAKRPTFDMDFFSALDLTAWVEEEANGGTIAWAAPHSVTLTTGSTNDDVAELSHASTWTATRNCGMQARVKMDIITAIGVNIGFVDADMSTNDRICFELTGTALTNARVTDGAAFVFDTDGTTDVWYVAAVDTDVEGTPAALSVSAAPVANTYAWFGITLDTSANATFYYNFKSVGYLPACTTTTALLLPYVSVVTRAAAAKVVTVDRIVCWQDED